MNKWSKHSAFILFCLFAGAGTFETLGWLHLTIPGWARWTGLSCTGFAMAVLLSWTLRALLRSGLRGAQVRHAPISTSIADPYPAGYRASTAGMPTIQAFGASAGAWLPALIIAAWVMVAAGANTSQFGDNIEQFIWAHGLEWGYWKHPPLPTFLFALAQQLLGPSVYTAYVMAALCLSVTAWFTWKIACRLLGEHWGTVAILLWGMQVGFTWRAQIYNHNSVLIMMAAVTVWTSMNAAQRRSIPLWMATGVAAGLAMLAKYQALPLLLALLGAHWRSGALASRRNREGLYLALMLALIVFIPHLQWLFANDFLPLTYARRDLQDPPAMERLRTLVAFLLTEVRFILPALAGLGLTVLLSRQMTMSAQTATATEAPPAATAKTWMTMLITVPAAFVCGLAVLGVHLEGHWVVQTFQFFPIWLAWRARQSLPELRIRPLVLGALTVHLIGMGFYLRYACLVAPHETSMKNDRIYPAAMVAQRVLTDWRKASTCPLSYLIGPPYEAGTLSVYSGVAPAVLESGDPRKSPWIDLADIRHRGAIYVDYDPAAFPQGVSVAGYLDTPGRGPQQSMHNKLYWGILPPEKACP